MFSLSLPITVVMLCSYCSCQKRWSCHVFTVVANNGGHVMFSMSLPITVAMLCSYCSCK